MYACCHVSLARQEAETWIVTRHTLKKEREECAKNLQIMHKIVLQWYNLHRSFHTSKNVNSASIRYLMNGVGFRTNIGIANRFVKAPENVRYKNPSSFLISHLNAAQNPFIIKALKA